MMNKDVFLREVRNIFPEGDIVRGYQFACEIEEKGETDNMGNPITVEYILNKFRDYHKSWNMKYAKMMARGYLSKEAENTRLTLTRFIGEGWYKKDFQTEITNIERDKYLFGEDFNSIYDKIRKIEISEGFNSNK